MRHSKHAMLVTKAVDAAIAAIEIYNKPSFRYREEAFAILMINAWELLLKARILKENSNRMRSIEIWDAVPREPGTRGPHRRVPRKTRSGNNFTIGLQRAAQIVRDYKKDGIDDICINNLDLLTEVRDCATHLHNKGRALQKLMQELGSAALKNFARACSTWFGNDLSDHNFCIMPVAFESPGGVLATVFEDQEKGAAKRILGLISAKQDEFPFDPTQPFHVGVKIEMRFVRTVAAEAIMVQPGPAKPGSIPIVVTEENALAPYPWKFSDLVKSLKRRYVDFKQNDQFNMIKKTLESNVAFCKKRLLDPNNPRSPKQNFYNPNILNEFDKHYRKRAPAPSPGPRRAPPPPPVI